MTAEFLRDAAATAAVFGFFASAWFGWAQDEPPRAWRKALIAGSILSLLTAIGGGVMTWRNWSGSTAFDADTSRTFGLVVGVEVALAGIGAAVLRLAAPRAIAATIRTAMMKMIRTAGSIHRPPFPAILPLQAAGKPGPGVLDTLEHMFEHRGHGGHWRWS
jgi:hypothetical protein